MRATARGAFRKDDRSAPPNFFAAEVAGLHWLAAATPDGGADVAEVLSWSPAHIELPRLTATRPTRGQAEEFGRRLARTHQAGASHHGAPPPELGTGGFIASLPLPAAAQPLPWGSFYARLRIAPFARAARDRGALTQRTTRLLDQICERLDAGDESLTGPAESPARLHGDLWSGNVIWTATGAVLIDPAAHGGHRETDLAMLELFGLPFLPEVIGAYHDTVALAPGRSERRGLHQLYPLLVHAVLFGDVYGARCAHHAAQIAARYH